MRRASRILAWAAAAAAALLLVAIGVALAVDPDAYRPAIERQLGEALGRRVSMQRLGFGISLRPTIVARDLRIANPAWASRPDLLHAAQVHFQIDLIALWHDRVHVHRVGLEGVDVLLERGADGAGNWVFAPERQRGDSQGPVRLPDIDGLALREGHLAWRDGDGRVEEVRVSAASAVLRTDRPFQLDIEAAWRGTPLRAQVAAKASLQDALRGGPFEVSLALAGAGTEATIDTTLAAPFSPEALDLHVRMQGAKLDALSALAGRALPAWGPYRWSGRVRYGDAVLQLDELAGTIEGLPIAPARIEVAAGQAVFAQAAPTQVALQGRLGGMDFDLDLSTAPLPQLGRSDAALPVSVRAKLPRFQLEASGSLTPARAAPRFDLAVKAAGDALEPVRLFSRTAVRGALPIDLNGRVSGHTQRYRARSIAGRVAGSTVAGELALDLVDRPKLSGSLALGPVDLAALRVAQKKDERARQPEAPPAWARAIDTDLRLRIAGITGLAVAAERLAGRLRIAGGKVSLDEFSGALAHIEMSGNATLWWQRRRPQLDLRLRIPVLDATALGPGSSSRSSQPWPDAPLPWASLDALDGNAEIELGRVKGSRVAVTGVAASVRLRDGALQISALEAVVAGVPLRGRATASAAAPPRLAVMLDADSIDVERVLAALRLDAAVSGRLGAASMTVETQGTTARALAANARVVGQVRASTLALREMRDALALGRVGIRAEPGAAVKLDAAGALGDTTFDLDATGGPLAELFDLRRAWERVEVSLRASRGGERLDLTASGPLRQILDRRDVPVRASARLDGARLQLTGTIADLDRPTRSPLRAELAVDSLARLSRWFGGASLPDIAMSGSAVATLGPGELSLREMRLQAGRSDASGTLRVRWQERTEFVLDLESGLLDLAPWLDSNAPATAGQPAAMQRPLPLEQLRAFDASVAVRAARVIGSNLDVAEGMLEAKLDRGLLELAAGFAEGGTRAELRFDAREPEAQAAARISTRELDPEVLKVGGVASGGPRFSGHLTLAATGTTPATLLRSARGELLFVVGAGKIRQVASPYVMQDVSRSLLAVLLPGRKPPDHSNLECAAGRFEIADSVARSPDGIAARFKPMDILGSGAVKVDTGEILFGFRAVRRRWLSISLLDLASGFARIEGTLAHPRVVLDTEGVLIRGGVAWATAGISLLATDFLSQLQRARDPCAQIAAKGRTATTPLNRLSRELSKMPAARGTSP